MTYRDILTECKKHIKDKYGEDDFTGEPICIYKYVECSECKYHPLRVKNGGKLYGRICDEFTRQRGIEPCDWIRNHDMTVVCEWLDNEVNEEGVV